MGHFTEFIAGSIIYGPVAACNINYTQLLKPFKKCTYLCVKYHKGVFCHLLNHCFQPPLPVRVLSLLFWMMPLKGSPHPPYIFLFFLLPQDIPESAPFHRDLPFG